MELEYRKLTSDELKAGLAKLDGWSVKEGQLCKKFEFDGYQKGLVFATVVGFLADHLDHHPDIAIGYQKVEVAMNTHAVKGLSPYDLELARRIDAVT